MFDRVLDEEFRQLGLSVAPPYTKQLGAYCSALEHWNTKINLTNLNGALLVRRLVAEPVWIGLELNLSGTLLDVGSGNGSPAIPLTVTRPFEAVHLVESRLKRAAFLRHVRAELQVSMAIHHMRLEEMKELVPDWITLQAVALSDAMRTTLRRFCGPRTKIAWITARKSAPAPNAQQLCVPNSETAAWIFQLDQS